MPPRNPWLCVIIAVILGVTALACVGGIIAGSLMGRTPDASLMTTAATCIGSLASFLVVVPRQSALSGDQQQAPAPPPVATPSVPAR